MQAKWVLDYDHITDKCYKRPGCPTCNAPIARTEDGAYRCFSCGKAYEADRKMLDWMDRHYAEKVEMKDCPQFTTEDGHVFGCGGKKCVETHYMRNHVTKKWQVAWSECMNCGMRMMV